MHLITGPPGSGKTERLLREAREALARRERVWWVILPHQRGGVLRRITRTGGLLGLEMLVFQQLYYRLLARAKRLKATLTASRRVALVGQALAEMSGRLPSPGETRLFAVGIAEAKRYGRGPAELPSVDPEGRRFLEVFKTYEQLKGDRWDQDDARMAALRLVEEEVAEPEAQVVIVDGFRELGPLELRFLEAISTKCIVWLSLLEAPSTKPEEQLAARSQNVEVWRAANPVVEMHWALEQLKRDLASGIDPLDLALIVPRGRVEQVLLLAKTQNLYLMSRAAPSVADLEDGRILVDLLELPETPTPSRMAHLSELEPLVVEAFTRGLSGREAIAALAEEGGLSEIWSRQLARLELAPGEELAWAEALLTSVPVLSASPFREAFFELAREARGLAQGKDFRAWWAALIGEMRPFQQPRAGVALHTARSVSGLRYRKVYVLDAVEGAYDASESEDYFLPEETRLPYQQVLEGKGLPLRLRGANADLWAELRTRADLVAISYAAADQGGLLQPELGLTGELQPEVAVPFPNTLGMPAVSSGIHRPGPEVVQFAVPKSVGPLQYYASCPYRYWARRHLSAGTPSPLTAALKRLQRAEIADPADLALLGIDSAEFERLTFLASVPVLDGRIHARVQAREQRGDGLSIHHFVPAVRGASMETAREELRKRWDEWLAARAWFSRGARRVEMWVHFSGAPPVQAYSLEAGMGWFLSKARRVEKEADAALKKLQEGQVEARPGFYCNGCLFSEVCRVREEV